jgi:hypothetical protein
MQPINDLFARTFKGVVKMGCAMIIVEIEAVAMANV